jgi:alkaline phosphatase
LGATTFFVTYGKARFAKSVYLCKDKKNFKFFKKHTMKKYSFLFLFLWMVCLWGYAQEKPKYVFYFIGDGMGVNQVLGTEMYQAELQGNIGVVPMQFSLFPHVTMATTFSATNGVTDSAASGTALATGNKTKNGAIGVMKDLTTPVNSVAVWAKEAGMKVGIATSVSVDHATPSAFYAHQGSRNSYYNIGLDLYTTGFDFYAGSDFLEPYKKNDKEAKNLYELAPDNGYVIARGYKDYLKKSKKTDKIILLQPEEDSKIDRSAIPYAIDRKKGNLTLQEITRAGINFLTKNNDNGFFLMVEGGKIDWACHANDGATAFQEVIDFDNAVKVAYEFYSQHPDETLIVITADHSTGGLSLGTGAYELNLQVLKNQKLSEVGFTKVLNELRKKTKNKVTWEMVKEALTEYFGFWKEVKISERTETRLKHVYERSFQGEAAMEKSEYSQSEPMASEAKRIINSAALIGWASGGHSAGLVPVCAIGVGAEKFSARTDNSELPKKIAEIAGYKGK